MCAVISSRAGCSRSRLTTTPALVAPRPQEREPALRVPAQRTPRRPRLILLQRLQRQAVTPEKYDLKLPDNAILDASVLERTAATARALGLSNEHVARPSPRRSTPTNPGERSG
jgi:hypothetical protein